MTIERASEIVSWLKCSKNRQQKDMAIDLFCHFVDLFGIDSTTFAQLCGYPIATDTRWLE